MKNPSFGALHSPLPSQSEIQGRNPEEEIQQPAFPHGCAKFCTPCETTWGNQRISHIMQNFPRYAKSSCAPTPLNFYLQIFYVISYFLLVINLDIFFYIFIYLWRVTSFKKRMKWEKTCKFLVVRNIQSFCSLFLLILFSLFFLVKQPLRMNSQGMSG